MDDGGGLTVAQRVPAKRKPRQDGKRSRAAIVTAAAQLATLKGLDGLSIGDLADYVGMSKSGLYAHFGSKEELQLAAIDAAIEVCETDVVRPALQAATPLERLTQLYEKYLDYVDQLVFPGGCFFAAANAEFDTRTGVVRDRLVQLHADWMGFLTTLVTQAQDDGAIGDHEDPEQLAFELEALMQYANSSFLLSRDQATIGRARRALTSRLAIASHPPTAH